MFRPPPVSLSLSNVRRSVALAAASVGVSDVASVCDGEAAAGDGAMGWVEAVAPLSLLLVSTVSLLLLLLQLPLPLPLLEATLE